MECFLDKIVLVLVAYAGAKKNSVNETKTRKVWLLQWEQIIAFGSMIKGERIECFSFLVGFL